MTVLLRTIPELHEWREAQSSTVALVPTMGALHEGHLELVRTARTQADSVIVSDFVNPLQFGPEEDFARYPRDIEGDVAALEGLADAVFAPSVEEIYPVQPPMQIDVGPLAQSFEGAMRPGHFSGVATVVLKLFLLTSPHIAVFGEKDAQQLAIIRRLVADFNVPVRIVSVPIVRTPEGLARSSRNAYLDKEGLRDARALSAVLADVQSRPTASEILRILRGLTDSAALTWDYAAAVDPQTLKEIGPDYCGEVLVLLAARVQGVRLLDNARVYVNER